jgi:predicted transcriptional regulator
MDWRVTKRSRSFIVQGASSTYVQDRADYMGELDEAVRSADSGIGHSGEQTFGWMSSWGTSNELALPEPDIHSTK